MRKKWRERIDIAIASGEFVLGAIIGGIGKYNDSDLLIGIGMAIMCLVAIDLWRKM